MWLRPAFLQVEGQAVSVMHGRPLQFGPFRLYRRRDTIQDSSLAETAVHAGLIGRPMNAHALAQWLADTRQPEHQVSD